jgi:hypothetical protein
VGLGDVAKDPAAHQLDGPTEAAVGGALVPHLGDHTRAGGGLAHQASLRRGLGEWLLTVDVLARANGQQRRKGVGVVGGRDGDGVDLLADLVE